MSSINSFILSGEEISPLIKKVVDQSSIDSGEQVQPAGYDVTLLRVFSYPKDEEYSLSREKTEGAPLIERSPDSNEYFELYPQEAYLIELNEITTIPKDAIGILFPRSTLLRNGLDLRSALFDPGYSGQPKVMLVSYRKARIQRFARVGQLVLFRAGREFPKQYKGTYQGERSAAKK